MAKNDNFSLTGGRTHTGGKSVIVVVTLLLTSVFVENSLADTPLTTLRRETRNVLKQQATAPKGSKNDDAVTALCDLYVLIRQDDRYQSSEMLQQDAAKIRRRLLNVAQDRKNQLKRNKVSRSTSLSDDVDTAIKNAINAPAEKRGGLGKLAFQGGQAAGGVDNGWQLVELIQRIVEPDFWEVQGGPGTVRYFGMRRVLVVRATTDVHEQIRDLLLTLSP